MKTMMAVAAFALAIGTVKAQIRQGDIAMLKPYAMLFGSASALDAWQRDQKALSPEALKVHEQNLLGSREVWEFIRKAPVRVLSYLPSDGCVQVWVLEPADKQGAAWVNPKDLEELPRQ
jgi:hypothetical protein